MKHLSWLPPLGVDNHTSIPGSANLLQRYCSVLANGLLLGLAGAVAMAFGQMLFVGFVYFFLADNGVSLPSWLNSLVSRVAPLLIAAAAGVWVATAMWSIARERRVWPPIASLVGVVSYAAAVILLVLWISTWKWLWGGH
jgi:hypothetical protein